MKPFYFLSWIAVMLFYTNVSVASPPSSSTVTIRGHLRGGMSKMVVDWGKLAAGTESAGYGDGELHPRFIPQLGLAAGYRLNSLITFLGGVDMTISGFGVKSEGYTRKDTLASVAFPLGVLFSPGRVRVATLLAPSYMLNGKATTDSFGQSTTVRYDENNWRDIRRLNLTSGVTIGYAFFQQGAEIIPGLSFEMDLLNTAKGDLARLYGIKMYRMALMLSLEIVLGI